MKPFSLRAGLMIVGLAFGLASCLSSDAPNLSAVDLTEPAGFGGTYLATDFPEEKSDQPAADATVEAIGDRSYRLTFAEGERKDAPVILRLLTLNDGALLGVISDPDPTKGAIYALVTQASNGSWVFRMINFKSDSRGRTLRDALMRHGAQAVDFGTSDPQHDHIKGALNAANLRALFSDPDFTRAIETVNGFRLSPTTSAAAGIALP
jgi:hypothetical protein